MQNDDGRDGGAVVGSQRQHEVTDVFDHSTDDDVVLSQFGVLHGIELDVGLGHWMSSLVTHAEELALHIVDSFHVVVLVVLIVSLVEFCSNLSPFILIDRLVLPGLRVILGLIGFVLVVLSEHLFSVLL